MVGEGPFRLEQEHGQAPVRPQVPERLGLGQEVNALLQLLQLQSSSSRAAAAMWQLQQLLEVVSVGTAGCCASVRAAVFGRLAAISTVID